jgi:hypothetical protein
MEIARQLLTHYALRNLSAGLLVDIASTLDAEGAFAAEARMFRELSSFNAADNRIEALARLDPDVAAALRAVDPDLGTTAVKSGSNKPSRQKTANKSTRRK